MELWIWFTHSDGQFLLFLVGCIYLHWSDSSLIMNVWTVVRSQNDHLLWWSSSDWMCPGDVVTGVVLHTRYRMFGWRIVSDLPIIHTFILQGEVMCLQFVLHLVCRDIITVCVCCQGTVTPPLDARLKQLCFKMSFVCDKCSKVTHFTSPASLVLCLLHEVISQNVFQQQGWWSY